MAYPKSIEDNMQKRTHTDMGKFTEGLITLAVEAGMANPQSRVLKGLLLGGETALDLLKEFPGKKKEQAEKLLTKARKEQEFKMRAIKEPPPVRMSTYESQRSTKRKNEMLRRAAEAKARKLKTGSSNG